MLKAKVITQGRVRRRKQNDVKINIIPIWLSDLAFLLASLCFRENLFSPSIVVFSDLHGPTSDKTLLVLDGFRPSPCLKLLVVMVLIFPMGTADLIFLCSLLIVHVPVNHELCYSSVIYRPRAFAWSPVSNYSRGSLKSHTKRIRAKNDV